MGKCVYLLAELFLVLVVSVMTSSAATDTMAVIDLTYDCDHNAIGWPTHPPFNFQIVQRGMNDVLNLYLEYNKFAMGEHRGTHTDAPSHFAQGHWRSHQVPVSRLVGPGVVVDVSSKVKKTGARYKTTLEDVKAWEDEYGRIPKGAVVLINTGWGERYPDPQRVFNTNNISDTDSYSFPTIHVEVARFLAEEREINAFGVDFPSPDSRDPAFPVHVKLLSKDILILENVANLDRLPPSGTTIIIGMMKIHDGSGGPSRILALKDVCGAGDGPRHHASSLTVVLLALLTVTVIKRQ